MKKVITVALAFLLIIIALSGCAGKNANDNNQFSSSTSAVNSSISSKANSSSSNTQKAQSSKATNSAEMKNSESANLDALDSNGQSIENMLKGIANDNADISITSSQTSDADSLANQLNSYLNPSTDNIKGLN